MQDCLARNLTREQALGYLGNRCPGGLHADLWVQSPIGNHLSQVSQLFCGTQSALHFAAEKQSVQVEAACGMREITDRECYFWVFRSTKVDRGATRGKERERGGEGLPPERIDNQVIRTERTSQERSSPMTTSCAPISLTLAARSARRTTATTEAPA